MQRSGVIFAVAVGLAGEGAALGETVHLKNGTVLRGSIVSMNDVELTIETADMGQIQVKRRAVQSFEDDSGALQLPIAPPAAAAAPPAIVAATPLAAAAPMVINNNNNNNNNNAATTAATVASTAPVPAPAAPAPAAAGPAAELKGVAPPAAPGDDTEGMVFGALRGGVAYSRYSGGAWSKPVPTIHWDLVGYRWDNGVSVTAFGEGSQKDSDYNRQWLEGGLQVAANFGRRMTRYGSGAFFVGAGGGYVSVTQAPRLTDAQSESIVDAESWEDAGSVPAEVDRAGYALNGAFGYQFTGQSGLGFSIALTGNHAYLGQATQKGAGVHCPAPGWSPAQDVCAEFGSHTDFQTVGVTAGLAYAL